jgi:hypothetical protein
MSDDDSQQWWVASLGDVIVWARLKILPSGIGQVLDASGDVLRFDDEEAARNALLDANFRAFDGLDEEDAAVMGFDLDSVEPPRGESDEDLLPQMTEKLTPGHN